VEKFLSGIRYPSFHSIKNTIIADNAADGKMNNLQLAIVYAKYCSYITGVHLQHKSSITKKAY
jgi:hypothetical protein